MTAWSNIFYFSIISASLMMSMMGVWFTAIMPWSDLWNKRFFLYYFIALILCCFSCLLEMVLACLEGPRPAVIFLLVLESLFLSLPLVMQTFYLLHSIGENVRESKLLRIVLFLWTAYFVLVIIAPFTSTIAYVTSDNQYHRGLWYPLLLLPVAIIALLNLAGTIRYRKRLTHRYFVSLLIALLPMAVSLLLQMIIDVYPIIDLSFVLSALSMYGLIISDHVERDLHLQREIANQRSSIMVLKMRPHFIYNTLMSIYSLCNQDPQKARQVTMDFTNYLRKNFNAVASESSIPFSAELEHTRAYLAVEQAQSAAMLLVDYDTPFTNFRLPSLTLQPIVENSVKHGMNPYSGPLHISIRTRHTDTDIIIIVEDNGPGFDPSDETKPHTTLTNIKQRLEMMCGGSLTIQPRDGSGTVVTVTISDSAT